MMLIIKRHWHSMFGNNGLTFSTQFAAVQKSAHPIKKEEKGEKSIAGLVFQLILSLRSVCRKETIVLKNYFYLKKLELE